MFSPLWRKLVRDLWLQRARSSLVIAAMTLGLVAAGTLLDTWALVRRVTAETFAPSHPVSARLRLANGGVVDASLLALVKAQPGVAAVRARRVVSALLPGPDGAQPALVFALDDFERRDIGHLQSTQGDWPPPPGAVVVEESASAMVGTALTLQVGDAAPRVLPIVGRVRDVSLAPAWMDHLVTGYATSATLERLGAPPGLDEIEFVASAASVDDRAAIRATAQAVRRRLEQRGLQVAGIDVPPPREHPHAAQMASLVLTQAAFGALTLLVSCCLVINLMRALLRGQAREIGIMKAIGAATGTLLRLYLAYALALGTLTSLVALPLALVLARRYAALQCAMLNFPLGDTPVPAWALALQLGAGCLLPVLVTAWPVWRACAVPAAIAMRDGGIDDGGLRSTPARVRRRRSVDLTGLGRTLTLALANAFQQRTRLLMTLLPLAAGGAVFLAAADLRHAVHDSIDQFMAGQHFDVELRFDMPQPLGRLEAIALAADAGLQLEAWSGDNASLLHDGDISGDRFELLGVPADSALLRPTLRSGRTLQADDGCALVVSRTLQHDEPELVPGFAARIVVDGRTLACEIVGVADVGPQKVALLPRATRVALLGDGMRRLAVAAAPEHRADGALTPAEDASEDQARALTAQLRQAFDRAGVPVAGSRVVVAARAAIEDHMIMVVNFLGAMGWVMLLVGAIGLAATMGIAVLERRREIGVMRAIGARHRAILGLILGEGLLTGLLGWLLAVALSVPLGALLAQAFGRIMFATPWRPWPDAASLTTWLLLAVIISLLACAWPAWRALRIPTAAALSYV